MVYGITVSQVLVAHSESWEGVAKSMSWWVKEVLHSWNLPGDDQRWTDAAAKATEDWKTLLHLFHLRDIAVRQCGAYPLWQNETPAHGMSEGLPVRVGSLTPAEIARLPQPGSLAQVRFDENDVKKVKVVSHHAGTMTSTARITSRKGMARGAARRVITVPWAYLSPRPQA